MARRVFVNAWVGVDNHGEELLIGRRLAYRRTTGETDVTVTSFAPDASRRLHGPMPTSRSVRSCRTMRG